MSRMWRTEQGQSSAEYLGLLLVVAAIIAAISASGVAGTVTGAISRSICEISQGGAECGAESEAQVRGEAPQAATSQDASARYERRRVELARERDALASDTTMVSAGRSVSTGGPADPADDQIEDGPRRAGDYRALELWSPTSSVSGWTLPADRERRISSGTSNRSLRTELGVRIPTSGDADGDGLRDPRPASQREEGNAGDRFAGELCGIGESVAFGLLKGPGVLAG
ncbi:MAG: hypothetical protein MSC31_01025 [Solirubrobacteraceae bacterium MAG38_C4-C5]|nr:hypothetical protein [Candidatus Siliceabacter maunaloa]